MSSNATQHVETLDVTPELAHEWLGWNTHNRNLRRRTVDAYAADMTNGDWLWNGESIKFADDGTLLDGQHRLAAVVQSGVTVGMLVVRGLPSDAQDTVDSGIIRKFADVLHLRGEKNAPLLAAVIRKVAYWETGHRRVSAAWKPTVPQMLQILDKQPDLRDITAYAQMIATRVNLPASVIGLCIWAFSRVETEERDQLSGDVSFFFERLRDGQNIAKGDPIYELRKAVANSVTNRGQRGVVYLTAILIKAWNAYRDGAKVGVLAYRPGGSRPEQFPEPR